MLGLVEINLFSNSKEFDIFCFNVLKLYVMWINVYTHTQHINGDYVKRLEGEKKAPKWNTYGLCLINAKFFI